MAEAVESKRQADGPILRGMVRQEVNKINEKKNREIKSLKAQLKQLKAKPSKKGNSNDTSNNFWSGGGLAQKNHAKTKDAPEPTGTSPSAEKALERSPEGYPKTNPLGRRPPPRAASAMSAPGGGHCRGKLRLSAGQ